MRVLRTVQFLYPELSTSDGERMRVIDFFIIDVQFDWRTMTAPRSQQ